MSLCPFATQKPVSAHGGPMGRAIGLVLHVTAGEGDPYNEFANPANRVSSHFGIGNGQGGFPDGALEQYVDTGLQSWAQAAGNVDYFSVETEGEPNDALSPSQVHTLAWLYVWLSELSGIPFTEVDIPGEAGFILHSDGGVPWGDHLSCPGPVRAAQRQVILNEAAAILHPGPAPSKLAKPAVGVAITPSGKGYWIAAADGGVFAYGDAPFDGSMGGKTLAAPVVGISGTLTGRGYILVAADGGIFCFGDATFEGTPA